MDTKKLPKFEWERTDGADLGHVRNEWGAQEDIAKIRIMQMYDLKWNTDEKDDN